VYSEGAAFRPLKESCDQNVALATGIQPITFMHKLKESLHKITPKYETLIISNKKGPNHPVQAFLFITVKVAQFQNEDRIKIFISIQLHKVTEFSILLD